MDELREEQGHIRLYDRTLEGLVVRKSWRNEAGLNCLLVRDAYRGTNSGRFSTKCKGLYDEGFVCAEYSIPALMEKFGATKPTILRWVAQLEEDGLVKRRHEQNGTEKSIFEVGYWQHVRRQDGTLERIHMYYCNEASHVSMTTPSNENMTGASHVSMTTPRHENMTQSHTQQSQTQQDTNATQAPSVPVRKTRISSILTDEPGEERSLADTRTAHEKKAEKSEKPKSDSKWEAAKKGKEVLDYFAQVYREKVGAAYAKHASDLNNIIRNLSDEIGVETMCKAIDVYLDCYDKLQHHEGLPGVMRMLHQTRWKELVYAAQTGNRAILPLVSSGNDRAGNKGDKETKARQDEAIALASTRRKKF